MTPSQRREMKATDRGRFQAQGNDLKREQSWPWARQTPLPHSAAITGLGDLCARLRRQDLARRERALEKLTRFMDHGRAAGGIEAPITRTFQDRNLARDMRDARLDLEVWTGRAFV